MPTRLPELDDFDQQVLTRLIDKGYQPSYMAPSNDWPGIAASDLRADSFNRKNYSVLMQDTAEIRKSLERLTKHGLAIKTYLPGGGQYRMRGRNLFKSKKVADEIAAEVALSPEERAGRFMAHFKEHYLAEQRRIGDVASRWPRPVERYGDGLEPALELGLLVHTGKVSAWDSKQAYVPTEFYSAYVEALQLEQYREAMIKDKHEALAQRLGKYTDIYSTSSVRVELTYAQVEKLLTHLES